MTTPHASTDSMDTTSDRTDSRPPHDWVATDFVAGAPGELDGPLDVLDPATGRACGRVTFGDPADAARRAQVAADAAAAAFPGWRDTAPRARAGVLLRAATLLEDRVDELAYVLAVEAGKRLPEAVAEVRFSSEYLRWFAEEVRRPRGEVFASEDPARRQLSLHKPLGVVTSLTPWNFPISIQARKVAPALAAGCTVVARVSEKAPLAVSRWLAVLQEAGLPAGVLNVVHGDARSITGTWLDHPAVRGVSFTGSTGVGAQIMAQAARRIVRPLLELGGNAPFVVLDDADRDVAVTQAELGKLRNSGQSCVGINRFLVHRSVIDEFGARLAERFDRLALGPGTADPVPDLGPVIDQDRVDAVTGLIDGALAAGGRRLTAERPTPADGFWVAPTLIGDLPASHDLATEEVFGPAAGIFPFDTDEEAVRLANGTEMGLAAYVITRDARRAFTFADRLDSGIVGVNDALPSVAFTPMGGTKQSGLGREGGAEGLREFQETTYLAWRP